jgi:hypothetical protein
MTKAKSNRLEFSSPAKEVMVLKITKKKFLEYQKHGITQVEFDEGLLDKLESNTIFDTTTYESGGYEVDLYLDGVSVNGFKEHLEKIISQGDSNKDIERLKRSASRKSYYFCYERFYKAKFFEMKISGNFDLQKIDAFLPRKVEINNQILSGFELSYNGNDFHEVGLDFGGDTLFMFDSDGNQFDLVID